VRRLILVLLASALALSACSQGNGWPGGSSTVSQAPSIAATARPTAEATPTEATPTKATPTKATPTKATPTKAPTPAATGSIDADWVTVTPSGVGFTSKWPGDPTKTSSTSATSAGNVVTTIWTYEDGVDLAYFVGVVAYPKGAISGTPVTTVYDAAVKSMTTSTGTTMTISSQGDLTVNGHAGRGFTLTSSTLSIQGAMVIIGDTLYTAYIAYTPAVTDLSSPEVFFNDFNLTI
jgi:hypothetical protein